MTENPEDKVAQTFGRVSDPLEAYNAEMKEIDVDWYDRYLEKRIPRKGIDDSYAEKYEEAFEQWTSFMERAYPDREPTLASHHHVEAWIENLIERMSGDSARTQVNLISKVYEWMQTDNRFPHPDEYHPYELAKKNNPGLLKSPDPREFPQLDLDDIREQVQGIKHVGERAVTVFGLKTGARPGEIGNVRFEDLHLTNVDVLNHYDGGEGQEHDQMGSNPQLDGRPNAVFIDTKKNRPGNKRKRPTVIPLDDELRRVLIDWLLIRPDNGSPWVFLSKRGGKMTPSNLQYIWRKHWWPEYEVTDDDEKRSVTPHYARHWFTSWFRLQARMPEPWVKYMRGDVQSSDLDNTRDAFHRYIHTTYEQIEDEYRNEVFSLGL